MGIHNPPQKKFWKIMVFVSLAAISLIALAKSKPDVKGVIPEAGDDSNIFEQELSGD
jgi:hypothetical protein